MKKLSIREKVLLVLLGIMGFILLYYYLFYIPTQNKIAELEAEYIEIDDEIIVAEVKVSKLQEMQNELKRIKAEGDENLRQVPAYDNRQNLMSDLSSILAKAQTYNIRFNDVTTDDVTISRNITLNFTCNSYQTSKAILQEIYNGQYPCAFTNVFLSNEGTTVSLDIIYFEYGDLNTTTAK